jgi:catechol 2,3-dioxygenase-like lactoylglutathione lyase family enzyme
MIMMQKSGAIALFVQDLDACTAFYRDTLQLPYRGSEPGVNAVFLLREGLSLVLLSPTGAADVLGTAARAVPSAGGPRGYQAASVADVDATYQELKGKGVAFVQPPTDKPWGLRLAHFADPEGNLWEITQPIASNPEE